MVGGVGGAGLSLRWGAAPATAVGIPKKKRKEMKNKRGKPFIFLKKPLGPCPKPFNTFSLAPSSSQTLPCARRASAEIAAPLNCPHDCGHSRIGAAAPSRRHVQTAAPSHPAPATLPTGQRQWKAISAVSCSLFCEEAQGRGSQGVRCPVTPVVWRPQTWPRGQKMGLAPAKAASFPCCR